jgi:hypothetical protein
MDKIFVVVISLITIFSTNAWSATVSGNFEGSNIYSIEEISPNVFTCKMKPDIPSKLNRPNHMYYWFYLKICGAANQTITIKLINCEWMPDHWDNYKPVYSYAKDTNDLSKHDWQKITNTSRSGQTFSFTHTYMHNTVWVALRYPYMYTYLTKYVDSIRANPYVTVESIAKSREDRTVYWIKITDSNTPMPKREILILAREHASEQDGSWVCEGMIKFLLSDDPKAIACRKRAVFMIIPMVNPDAAYYGRNASIVTGNNFGEQFMYGKLEDPEAIGIWGKIKKWINRENTFNICISLHNPHGSEPNVWLWNGGPHSGKRTILHKEIKKYLNAYTTREDSSETFYIGRALQDYYDTVSLGYEINMHAIGKFLKIEDFNNIGGAFVKGICDYYGFQKINR